VIGRVAAGGPRPSSPKDPYDDIAPTRTQAVASPAVADHAAPPFGTTGAWAVPSRQTWPGRGHVAGAESATGQPPHRRFLAARAGRPRTTLDDRGR